MSRKFLAALALLAAPALVASQERAGAVALSPASAIIVEGTSNIHDWKAETSTMTAEIQIALPLSAASKVEAVTLAIPVQTLKSGRGGLDKNLYKAMHADRHPEVVFRMTSYRSAQEGDAYAAIIGGVLTVNGVSKEIEASARMTEDSGALSAAGSIPLLMTDFGIKPVTALFGTIRTANEVTVHFNLVGTLAKAVAGLPN